MVCIVTFARSWQALVATRALGKAGIKVVTADSDKYATSFFSKYSVDHFIYSKDEKQFIKDLVDKCKYFQKKYREDVMILPIHNETYKISKHKKKLMKYAKLCVEDFDKIQKIHNKSTIPKVLKKLNIRHPKTFVVKDMIELYKIVPNIRFPVFLKLTESAASIGLVKVNERDDCIYEYKKLVNEFNLKPASYPIVQEGVPGKDYCLTAILNKGKIRAMMTYVNIKCHPYKSGPGVYRKNVNIPQMEAQAKKFLRGVRWHGVIELDYRMGSDKKPFLIEANPRFWGGLNQSVASNVNYPLMAYNIAMHGDCEIVTKFDKTMRTENLTTAVIALFDEMKKDEQKQKELEKLRKHFKAAFREKQNFNKHMNLFFKQLSHFSKKKYNYRAVKEFIERRKLVKDDILDKEDPFVVLGIFYPVHLLLKYGKVNKMMLTSENPHEKSP